MLYFLECLDIWILVRQAGSAFTGSRDFLWFFFFGKLGLERTFDPEGNRQQSWAEVLFSIVVKLEITKKYPLQKWKKKYHLKWVIFYHLDTLQQFLSFSKIREMNSNCSNFPVSLGKQIAPFQKNFCHFKFCHKRKKSLLSRAG